jgi:DNA polymerase-3 subunit delta'
VNTVIGQDKALASLDAASAENRRHHALVFSGPRGVGKFTSAVNYAISLLKIPNEEYLGFPDLHIIQKEDATWSQNPQLQKRKQTNIPLDLLRERMIGGKASDDKVYGAPVFKTPTVGGEKVFIIDEAELIDETGQNALLSTLEEPPLGTTIILVTCREDLLLQTVKSRCQFVCFAPLDNEDMSIWAEDALSGVDQKDVLWAIGFSCGSPGLALDAINTGLPQLGRSLFSFLSCEGGVDYTGALLKINSFVESTVLNKLTENNQASKAAVGRWAVELILLMFGNAARLMIQSEQVGRGVVLSDVISDIERQLSTNVSTKVLLESLAARWQHVSVGDSVFL